MILVLKLLSFSFLVKNFLSLYMHDFISNSSILITGGTGSFGKAFTSRILKDYPNIKKLVVFSRDELKQWEMQKNFPEDKFPQIRFFLGDIRDKSRLIRALEGINVVIHAAALKQVPAAEYNPFEFIKTNVLGSENLLQACLDTNVSKLIALSTDKAAAPINLYGATKLCSDKLFIAANNIVGKRNLNFSIVRYGNVMGSRGSVIPFFLNLAKTGRLPITNKLMTRFNISLDEGVDMVLWAINNSIGGEIFVPKIPSYRIMDVAEAIGPNCKKDIVGIRPGEKIDEEMITKSDGLSTIDLGKYYAILPSDLKVMKKYESLKIKYELVKSGFSYNSGTNNFFLSIKEIRELIIKHIDNNFKPF